MTAGGVATLAAVALGVASSLGGAEKPAGPTQGLSCPTPGPSGGAVGPAAPARAVRRTPPPIDAHPGGPTEVATFGLG